MPQQEPGAGVMLRQWLLSRQCQLTAQAVVGVLTAALFTVARPLQFPHACLAPVFVVIVITSLAQDQHVGSRVQVTAMLLGPTWLAVLLVVALMTLAKLAENPSEPYAPGYMVAATLLALLGLAVLVLVRAAAPAGPARLMGMLSTVLYGIMVLLSAAHPGLGGFLTGAVGYVLLALLLASVVSLATGLLVAPSLASDEVVRLTAEALQGAGSMLSYHTSALLAEHQSSTAAGKLLQANTRGPSHDPDIGSAVHSAPARRVPAAATQHSLSTSSGDGAVVAAAAAAHIAAARQQLHGTLDWVADAEMQQFGHTPSAPVSACESDASSARTGSVASSSSSPSVSDFGAAQTVQVTGDQVDCRWPVDTSAGSTQQVQQLDMQLLHAAAAAGAQDHETIRASLTSAWVAAASQQGSLLLPEESEDAAAPFASVRLAGLDPARSLEHPASLDFQPEADDEAFLQAMRTLSRSKPYGSTASLHKLQQQQVQQEGSRQQIKHSKSAVSVMSVAGSFLDHKSSHVFERCSASPDDKGSSANLERRSLPAAEHAPKPVLGRRSLPIAERVSAEGTAATSTAAAAAAGVDAAGTARQAHVRSHTVGLAGVHETHSSTYFQHAPSECVSTRPFAGPTDRPQLSSRRQQLSTVDAQDLGNRKSRSGSLLRVFQKGIVDRLRTALVQNRPPSNLAKQRSGTLPSCVSWADLHDDAQVQHGVAPPVGIPAAIHHRTPAAWPHSMIHSATGNVADLWPHAIATEPGGMPQGGALHDTGSVIAGVQKPNPVVPVAPEHGPSVTAAQLGLLIGRAKVLLAAARLEPLGLRPNGLGMFDADAWGVLLEDAELLLVRVSTLEALSDERRLQGLQLHHLQHYRSIADAMSMTLAQLAAFLAHVSTALKRQQASHYVHPLLNKLHRLLCCLTMHGQQATTMQGIQNKQPVKASTPPTQFTPDPQKLPSRSTAQSPFATSPAVATAAAGISADDAVSQEVISWSAVLSGLERQGSCGSSSYLWEKKAGWETGRQLLQREMEAAVGGYWWAVRTASRKAPVQVPNSREVMTLTFIWPITNGLLDALERVESSAQRVLSGTKPKQPCKQIGTHPSLCRMESKAPACATDASNASHGGKQLSWISRLLRKEQHQQRLKSSAEQQRLQQGMLSDRSVRIAEVQSWLRQQQQWMKPLLVLLTVQPGLQAMKHAVVNNLPAALTSKQGLHSLLSSRKFQAGMKMYLAMSSTLVLTMVLMVYVPAVRQVAPIFGFTSVCLSMQERVEATADKVVGRVLGTILGAVLGLAITQIPNIFDAPVLLLACIGAASVPLSIMARAEARVALALALITLLAVSLCTYEMACCTPGPHMGAVIVFLARFASVVGACLYVALLNQLILPWYTSDYALEQMADALEQAASLFERIYLSQFNRMRMAAVAAGTMVDGAEACMIPSTASAADALLQHTPGTQQAGLPQNHTAPSTAWTLERMRRSLDLRVTREKAAAQAEAAAATAPAVPTVLEAAAAQLAALEAAEAGLHVALRQEVLQRLVNVQLSLAKESVSWKTGFLATPQAVFDVLGAMVELVEALACQRLALAPFTRQGATGASTATSNAADGSMPGALLRVSGHCFSVWAQPLHPSWLEVLAAVNDLTRTTAQELRRTHASAATTHMSKSSRDALLTQLSRLEAARLELRRGWMAIRTNLHKHVHAGSAAPASTSGLCRVPAGARFWPIDSVHFFTFTYGASRVLNKLAGVTQTLLAATATQQSWISSDVAAS